MAISIQIEQLKSCTQFLIYWLFFLYTESKYLEKDGFIPLCALYSILQSTQFIYFHSKGERLVDFPAT